VTRRLLPLANYGPRCENLAVGNTPGVLFSYIKRLHCGRLGRYSFEIYTKDCSQSLARRLVHCPSDRRANKHRQSRSTVRLLILRFVATVSPPKKQLRELVKTRYIVASMGCERLCNRKELSGKPTNKTFNQGVVGSSPTALTKSKTMDRKY
jgi:hypothetical protein